MAAPLPATPADEDLAKAVDAVLGGSHPTAWKDPGPDRSQLLRLVSKCYREGTDATQDERRKRALNRAFYLDKQWVGWDYRNGRLNSSPKRPEVEDTRYLQQFNVFKPAIDIAVSRLAAATVKGKIDPGSCEQEVIEAARVAERVVCDHESSRLDLASIMSETDKACLLDADAFWKVEWDPLAGKVLGLKPRPKLDEAGNPVMKPQGPPTWQPATHPETGEPLFEEDGTPGMEPVEAEPEFETDGDDIVYEGQIRLGLVLADDMLIDPTALKLEDAGWVMHISERSPSWVYQHYNAIVRAHRTDEQFPYGKRTPADRYPTPRSTRVMELHIAPGRYPLSDKQADVLTLDKGWIIVATEDDVLDSGPNFYDHGCFPFIHFRCLHVPGQLFGDTPANSLRAAQIGVNTHLTQVAMSNALCANPQTLYPIGANVPEADRNNKPGAWIRVDPGINGQNMPRRLEGAGVNQGVFQFVEYLTRDFVPSLMGQHEGGIAGGTPANVEAAAAFEALESKDLARLTPMANEKARGVERFYWFALRLIKQFWGEQRTLSVSGRYMESETLEFTGSMVHENFRIKVVPESVLPQSKAVKFQRNFTLFQAGLLGPGDTMSRIGEDPTEEPTLADLNISSARDENRQAKTKGIVTTLEETMRFHDHLIHLDEHKRLFLDPGFTMEAVPEAYVALYAHVMAHNLLLGEKLMSQMGMMAPPPPIGADSTDSAPPAATGDGPPSA